MISLVCNMLSYRKWLTIRTLTTTILINKKIHLVAKTQLVTEGLVRSSHP